MDAACWGHQARVTWTPSELLSQVVSGGDVATLGPNVSTWLQICLVEKRQLLLCAIMMVVVRGA